MQNEMSQTQAAHDPQPPQPAVSASAPLINASAIAPLPDEKEPVHATGIAGWLHRNRWFTKEPITYIIYQFFRSSMAAIPYGFGMAFGHHLFGLASTAGQKIGLTPDGINAFNKAVAENRGGLGAVEALGEAVYKPGFGAKVGRNMMRVANSPFNAAVQIALGFTMYRFTGGVIKNLSDRVMNEKNTEADTAYEVKNAPKTIWQTMKTNWPAESTGTPIAALVLGFMSAAFTPSPHGTPKLAVGEKWLDGVKRVWSPKAKLLQNAAVWTFSYSLFFLMAESLFKDKQISRGFWKGHPNSLKNGPDDIVGGPGAVNFKTPENDFVLYKSAEGGYEEVGHHHDQEKEKDDDRAKDSHQKLRYPFFTGEPSMGRFVIRRLLPVAVGISAYAALKRVGYLSGLPPFKNLTGPMEQVTVKKFGELKVDGDALKTVGNHTQLFLQNAWREGKATAMFGALWWATDAWGTWYDKFFHHLQKPENQVPLNEHQQEKHADLLARLNEKERGQGRAA